MKIDFLNLSISIENRSSTKIQYPFPQKSYYLNKLTLEIKNSKGKRASQSFKQSSINNPQCFIEDRTLQEALNYITIVYDLTKDNFLTMKSFCERFSLNPESKETENHYMITINFGKRIQKIVKKEDIEYIKTFLQLLK